MNKENKKSMVAKVLEGTAKSAAIVADASRCAYIFHQPKRPDAVKKLKKS
jgi:cyclic lactone autoinducer peptide